MMYYKNMRLNEFKKLVKDFNEYQKLNAKFGATDTEANCEFARLIRNLVLYGETDTLNMRQVDWELYDSMKGVGKARTQLNRCWRRIFEYYTETGFLAKEWYEIKYYVENTWG